MALEYKIQKEPERDVEIAMKKIEINGPGSSIFYKFTQTEYIHSFLGSFYCHFW